MKAEFKARVKPDILRGSDLAEIALGKIQDGSERDRDRAILEIVSDMCGGRWVPGQSHQDRAEQYGVDISTVRNWASNAAMLIRVCQGNVEEIRAVILGGVDSIYRLAVSKKTPDLKNALGALELRAKLLGALAPVKVEVQPPREELWTGVQEWLTHPTPELEAVLEAAGWVRRGDAAPACAELPPGEEER